MILSLKRNSPQGQCVFGNLYVDGSFQCYTLERLEVWIPCGTYPIEMTQSLGLTCDCDINHSLSHLLPLLDNVPHRTNIRIHSGNWPRDTEGCILVGQTLGDSMILQSRAALDPLVTLIQSALDSGDAVSLTIS